ncbi:MAG: ester cyclase [Actinobacteria bacterium]|nr:ester cyclase [Actinomycetota bacterium]
MAEDSSSIIRKLFDALNSKDLDGIEALAADNCELTDVASGEKFRGPEGARKNAEGWLTAFPDAKLEVLNVVSSGDWGFAEAVGRGIHSGPLKTPGGDVPPTGRQMELHFCTVVKVQDGKIVESRDYYDGMTIATQLGMMPELAESTA